MIKRHTMQSEFSLIANTIINRRKFVVGGATFSTMTLLTGLTSLISTAKEDKPHHRSFQFEDVPANTNDTVLVPKGFHWHVVASWGDPLWSNGSEFNRQTRGSAESQKLAFGDNNDGMELFSKDAHTILAVNNEYTNIEIMYGNRTSKGPETFDDLAKGKAAVGVSIMEILRQSNRWFIVKDSEFNRRITADTPTQITGPARGHDLVKTNIDPRGTTPLGTWANCGSGRTPWGTYLTCEENFNHYFASSNPGYVPTKEMRRYGIQTKRLHQREKYGWENHDERFDISKHPNEANRFGYLVEINPLDPSSSPKKHSALGRFKHENAAVVLNLDNHLVVYMGDDERGEFIYRFVSSKPYNSKQKNTDLLESGRLYVAKFLDNMRGQWIELTSETTGMRSQAEICIHTRLAGSSVGATTMDRPEWISVDPNTSDVYCCLTNNKDRGKEPNAGGDATPIDGPNPRRGNKYGQIIRWTPDGNDHRNLNFSWDLFLLAGNPTVHSDLNAGSANMNKDNLFNCPDGLAFDTAGNLWIQTDGNYKNEGDFSGMGNNQMLVANTETGEIKRFLVGPKECEVTGITWSTDKTTLFVGIQHPGERGNSHFPDGGNSVPRSSVIAIERDDGQAFG